MKWTKDLEIQKVRRMRLANIPFMDIFHLLTQESIIKVMLRNVKPFVVNNAKVLVRFTDSGLKRKGCY